MKTNSEKRMSIYDIAALAQVSTATVSKVINGKDGVSEKTRKKVQTVLNTKGFTPKISVNDPNYIAVLYNDLNTDVFNSDFTRKVLNGISDVIYDTDYFLTLLPFKSIPKERDRFSAFCHRQRISGCIFLDLKREDDFIYRISGSVPMVVINEDIKAPNVYSLISTDFLGAYQAVAHLVENGHRRIAMLGVNPSFRAHAQRLEAYQKVLENHNITVDRDYINPLLEDHTGFSDLWRRWEREKRPPTAIFATDDSGAVYIARALAEMGKRVPDDLSLVGFDDYDCGRIMSPGLTTVRQKLREKGAKAVDIIISSLRGELQYSEENRSYVYETELVVRDSVKKIK